MLHALTCSELISGRREENIGPVLELIIVVEEKYIYLFSTCNVQDDEEVTDQKPVRILRE